MQCGYEDNIVTIFQYIFSLPLKLPVCIVDEYQNTWAAAWEKKWIVSVNEVWIRKEYR